MKRFVISILALLIVAGLSSCTKEPSGTFDEGVFQPKYKISTIKLNNANFQTWNWASSKLSGINDITNNATYSFSYTGNQLTNTQIAYADGSSQNIQYTYSGDYLTRVEVYNGSRADISMTVNHNASDKISTVNIDVSDAFLIEAGLSVMNGTFSFKMGAARYLLSETAFESLMTMAQLYAVASKNNAKYSIDNKHFSITYTWNGDNVATEAFAGNVNASVTVDDISQVIGSSSPMISAILNYLDADAEYPLDINVERTTNYTYDDKGNPYWYCWTSGFDAQNLSKNNILTDNATGAGTGNITVTLPIVGTSTYPIQNVDLSHSLSYTYSYNKKKYPTQITISTGEVYELEYTK
ncbi:MAG: hypothetical protein II532_02875 [Bacteroidales bacterium]|nr:hypothetical protein [Bacteroidales bacterium]